jgi:mycofactocin precursor
MPRWGASFNQTRRRASMSEQTRAMETTETEEEAVVVDDLLVEEVSIDGMCGVY